MGEVNKDTIRLAVIGFGGYGSELVKWILNLQEQQNCRLVAAGDARLADLAEPAGRLRAQGVALYDDAFKMLDALAGKCEAVYIATSIHTHMPLVLAALERGFHVHLEKPPAATIQEVDRMIEAVVRAGKICIVGFHIIQGRDAEFLKQRISTGRLGKVRRIVHRACWPRDAAYYSRNDWAGRLMRVDSWVLDGPAMNALAHQVNNLLYLASPTPRSFARPKAVRAELYAAGPTESHDTAAIEISTVEGTTLYWLGSHCTEEMLNPRIDVTADGGSATWQPIGGKAEVRYADGTSESHAGGDCHERMIANFIEAIRKDDSSLLRCSLADTRAFTLALNGAHESSGLIHRIDAQHTRKIGAGLPTQRTVLVGLDEDINRAADQGRLFSDLSPAPAWTVATKVFDLAGYDKFPRVFRCR